MGAAQRTYETTLDRRRSACPESAHCYLPASIARYLGGFDALWLHYGPISQTKTPLVVHRAERAATDDNVGSLEITTRTEHRKFAGYQTDLYCLERNPGGGAVRHVQPHGGTRSVLWCVFAAAYRDHAGPHVSWIAPGLDLPIEGWSVFYGTERPGAALLEEASRLTDLLAGGGRRRGRPPRWRDPAWREIVERGEARKRAHPGLPIDDIARALGVNPRTYREYLKLAEREQQGGLHLLDGGQTT